MIDIDVKIHSLGKDEKGKIKIINYSGIVTNNNQYPGVELPIGGEMSVDLKAKATIIEMKEAVAANFREEEHIKAINNMLEFAYQKANLTFEQIEE